MKIYTKTGDDGTTGLIGGSRVSKADRRIECYGTADELNSALGLAAVEAPEPLPLLLFAIQNDLFVIGSHLATPENEPGASGWLPPLDETMVNRLEMQIDQAESQLTPLREFILPGGTETAARLHMARTICRRCERILVDFAHDRPVPQLILVYFNRLSDWTFTHARLANHLRGVRDVTWQKPL